MVFSNIILGWFDLWCLTVSYVYSWNKSVFLYWIFNSVLQYLICTHRHKNVHTLYVIYTGFSLQWRHSEHDCVSNHQFHDCLLNRLFRSRSKKTSKLRITGLCAENSPVTGEFPAQLDSNAENVPFDVIMTYRGTKKTQKLQGSTDENIVLLWFILGMVRNKPNTIVNQNTPSVPTVSLFLSDILIVVSLLYSVQNSQVIGQLRNRLQTNKISRTFGWVLDEYQRISYLAMFNPWSVVLRSL